MNASASAINNRDYVVVVDMSGSMTSRDCTGGKSRWESCQESTQALIEKVCTLDPDGVDFYFFNGKFTRFENITGEKVHDLFKKNSPMGSTAFEPVLSDIFAKHFAKQQRPTTVLFITDGEATDPTETQRAIIKAANKIEADEDLAISFIQVGKDDAAHTFLKKLDDDLQKAGAKFDIVDTITMVDMEGQTLEETLLAAIND
jgi:hypothetical protein